jgi:hypothetical protein
MQKRATGRIVLLALMVVSGVALGASAVNGGFPSLVSALEALAASIAPSLPAPMASWLVGADAGSAAGDAGPTVRHQTAPLSSAQLGAPLVHGTFLRTCGAPDAMKVSVNVTVKMGRAVGVTVRTDPPDPAVSLCIDRATRDLQWDVSPKTDHVTVTY